MSPFNMNYRARLAEVRAALTSARQENRPHDALALELAALVLERHLGEIDGRQVALV